MILWDRKKAFIGQSIFAIKCEGTIWNLSKISVPSLQLNLVRISQEIDIFFWNMKEDDYVEDG